MRVIACTGTRPVFMNILTIQQAFLATKLGILCTGTPCDARSLPLAKHHAFTMPCLRLSKRASMNRVSLKRSISQAQLPSNRKTRTRIWYCTRTAFALVRRGVVVADQAACGGCCQHGGATSSTPCIFEPVYSKCFA